MKRTALPSARLAAVVIGIVILAGCGSRTSTPSAAAIPVSPSAPSAAASLAPSAAASLAPPTAPSPSTTPSSATPSPASGGPDLAAASVAVAPLVGGLDRPVFVTHAGDGSGRLYVAEQPGRIRVVEDGVLRASPFLDITDRVTSGGERGLLGFAFPPGYGPARAVVYLHYSGANGDTVVSEFRLDPHDSQVLDPASERVVLTVPQPYPNHNGGWIGFDTEGMLLVALGDGGSGGDPENRASDPGVLLGKILRLDVRTPIGGPLAYAIPADNPFAGRADVRQEILHLGLRNPFRSSIDPATGDLWIGDVGQNTWEEVDVARAGARGLDFGWRRWEGRHCFNPPTGCDPKGVTMPVAEYGHGLGCSVIGGVVYRGEAIPALRGGYLFSDYCTGTLWAVDAGTDGAQSPATLMETEAAVSSIGTGEDGEVYLTDLSQGRLLRLVARG